MRVLKTDSILNSLENVGVSIRRAGDESELCLCDCIVKVGNSHRKKHVALPLALPETAISVAVAATAVGAAATLLARRTKSPENVELPAYQSAKERYCHKRKLQCAYKLCGRRQRKHAKTGGGSGVCPECKGEGFVLRRPSDESAEKARLNSKNLATRYTAGLPKKWSY